MPDDKGYRWAYIGERIKEARNRVGLTQKQVAGIVGVSEQTVRYWEMGRSKPSPEYLVELADYCDVTTDWLLGRDIVEAEVLKEANISFSADIKGLPLEDLDAVRDFIDYLRQRRRQRKLRGEDQGEQGAPQG